MSGSPRGPTVRGMKITCRSHARLATLLASVAVAGCVEPAPRRLDPHASHGTLVVRADLLHGVGEDAPRFLGYAVHARDGGLVLRSGGFSTDHDVQVLAPGEYRVVSAPAGLLLDDPPQAVVVIADGRTTRVDLRRDAAPSRRP